MQKRQGRPWASGRPKGRLHSERPAAAFLTNRPSKTPDPRAAVHRAIRRGTILSRWWQRLARERFKRAPCKTPQRDLLPAFRLRPVLSETRYALNGDLGVAYRASREGARDMVVVPNWFTCCEILPELPSIQGWVEAMTSLGRLIFFDQPGSGASDPVAPGALPTLEQWADSITAVLDDIESREAILVAYDGSFATAALFAATHPSRSTALVVLEGYAGSASGEPWPGAMGGEEVRAAECGCVGNRRVRVCNPNPDMPWNEEIRVAWARMERYAASPGTWALIILPYSRVRRAGTPSEQFAYPTLILQHADDLFIPPTQGKYLADHIPGAKYVELPGRNIYHFVEPWLDLSRRSPSSSPATRQKWPTTVFSPPCCSPTSWTRRAGLRRSATATGMHCSTLTTPS